MKARVLVVTQYFWPENFRINELVYGLANRGYEVEILTSIPNYPSGSVFKDYASNPQGFTEFHGCKVHRVPQFTRGRSNITLLLNYFSFVISSCIFITLKLRGRDYDKILGVQLSPIFSMLPALLCKYLWRIPLYFWVLDIWPESVLTRGEKFRPIYVLLKRLCTKIYSAADVLFLSSPGFRNILVDSGLSQEKMIGLYQWVESEYFTEPERDSPERLVVERICGAWTRKTVFTFTGNVGEVQNFPSLLRSLKKSSELENIVFLIVGAGRYLPEVERLISELQLTETVFCVGQFPSRYMPIFFEYSDYLVVSLKDLPIFEATVPGKVQSYMSSGKPVLGVVGGETASLIDSVGCGFTVSPSDDLGVARMFDSCVMAPQNDRSRRGMAGKKYALENFSLESALDTVCTWV